MMELENALRVAAITHVEALAMSSGGVLTWAQIDAGFHYGGECHHLATRPRGIFSPTSMKVGALSIKTVIPRAGRTPRYDDQVGSDAPYFEYRYQGEDPSSRDNVRLRQCIELELPVIYFYAVTTGVYRPIICRVLSSDPETRTFAVAPASSSMFAESPILRILAAPAAIKFERQYEIAQVRRRLHQDRFRVAVLSAYEDSCTICRLRRTSLLDAAHIIPDRERLGEAKVPNGLALCKLHHAAFDANLLGISPDLIVHLRKDLLDERDGPMLEHGLRSFNGQPIKPPRWENCRPDRELLAERFAEFTRSAA